MRLSIRTKLSAIVGMAAFAFLVLIGASSMIANRTDRELGNIERRLLPRVELAPRLDTLFEKLRRGLQDAVAAYDADALAKTQDAKDSFLEQLRAAQGSLDPGQAEFLRRAIEDYYAKASDVSRRLVAGETGEALLAAMKEMQVKHTSAAEALRATTAFDRTQLTHAFAAAARAQTTAGRVRLLISAVCLVFVVVLSLWFSRGMLRSVNALTAGLARFGRGEFDKPIVGLGQDELGEVATQANHMAGSLSRLAALRDHMDWLRIGQAGLSEQLRGELEIQEVANRVVRYLATYVGARVGAMYDLDGGERLRLVGQYALSSAAAEREGAGAKEGERTGEPAGARPGSPAAGFALGEGLVGEAAQHQNIMVVADPPPGYLSIRSGLGQASPQTVVLVPIIDVQGKRVTGIIELGLFVAWPARAGELMLSVRETISIAMEVARARSATRRLLGETQRQAEQLSSQEEELRSSNEELQSQQEELRRSNEELTLQAEELDAQRKILEERNRDLDLVRTQLERKATELSAVSAYKSQFLANMSHELRTPLNSMLLLSNLLAANETGRLTAKQVEYAQTIYAAGRDLLALINQVLDLAKIEAGRHDVNLAPVPLRELVTGLERVFSPLVQEKGLRLVIEVAADVPETIFSDRHRIEQVLNNLLANAIKFTERGEVTLRVQRPGDRAAFRRTDLRAAQAVAFVVSDTGLGIAAADQERIFAPFEQVDAAPDRRYGGTGLGLNIARELTNLLGGELQLHSTLGQGSTFSCFLPFEGPAEGRATPAGQHPKPTLPTLSTLSTLPPVGTENGPPPGLERVAGQASATDPLPASHATAAAPHDGSLLIIEDDARFAGALAEVIERQGLTCRIAPDGRSGLRMARDKDHRPQAIVLDVMLPDIDGWKVMEELRSDPATASIPVHFISGVDAAEHARALGAVGYLNKPATHRELIRVVQSLAPHPGRRRCRLLVVEVPDSGEGNESLTDKLKGEDLHLERVGGAGTALERLGTEPFDCLILDLSLPDMDGLEFLRQVRAQCGAATPAVVVYTARALSKPEAQLLEEYAEAVVVNEGSSTERLLDEVRLFVRRVNEGLAPKRNATVPIHPIDLRLKGRKMLIADDDMRTLYAISAMLRAKGVEILGADTGQTALTLLEQNPDVDAVLMDIMMPEMDGYEAMRRIRRDPRFGSLPIIAATAKAMKGDAEKCFEAGASDYLSKPIDPDALVALLHKVLPAQDPPTKPDAPRQNEEKTWSS